MDFLRKEMKNCDAIEDQFQHLKRHSGVILKILAGGAIN